MLRRGYILAALIATAAGYIGFFHLLPYSDIFLDNDRVSATFKDPNVFGPFLVFPIMADDQDFDPRYPAARRRLLMILTGGLLLSFSRGAWAHFAISATVGVLTTFLVTPDPRMRSVSLSSAC